MSGSTESPQYGHVRQGYKIIGFTDSEHKQRGDPRPNLITPEQYQDIRSTIPKATQRRPHYYQTIFDLARYLGLRNNEATTVHTDHINFQDGYVHIPEQKNDHPRQRQPMPQPLQQQLKWHIDHYETTIANTGGYIAFSKHSTNGHINQSSIQMFLCRLRKRTNLPILHKTYAETQHGKPLYVFNYHSLRHLYIQEICDKHGIRKAQLLARHESIQSTMQYLKSSFAKKQEVVNDIWN